MKEVLQEYLNKVVPKMFDVGYHLKLAKGGEGYEHLSEQSLFSHIINGVFGFSNLWRILDDREIFPYDEKQYRKFLSLYTTHDMHKTEEEKLGTSEFSVSLEAIEDEVSKLGLSDFADTTSFAHRAAMTHDRSSKHGDRLLADEDIDRLVEMVRIADTMASIGNPREITSLRNHLQDLSRRLAVDYRLYFHELRDIRGVLTNQIHFAVTEILGRFDFHPLLFFASGVIYLGPKGTLNIEKSTFIEEITEKILSQLTPSSDAVIDPESAYRKTSYDFESYIYSVVPVSTLLHFAYQRALKVSKKNFYQDEMKKWFGKSRKKQVPFETQAEFESVLNIQINVEDKYFDELLQSCSVYLYIADSIIRASKSLLPDERCRWFSEILDTPEGIKQCLSSSAVLFVNAYGGGKVPKYAIPLAYHFLKGEDFAQRSAISFDRGDVINKLRDKVEPAFADIDSNVVAQLSLEELHVGEDLKDYLSENLFLSLFHESELKSEPFKTYVKEKKKAHSRICSICARDTKYNTEIRTGILGDSAQEFSNRFLPQKTTAKNRRWCPTCYLEFALRAIGGLTMPPNVSSRKSMRLYLYVMPTYSLAPGQFDMFYDDVLEPFREVTALAIRDYGKEKPSHAHVWIDRRKFDNEMVQNLIEVFQEQAEWVEEHLTKDGNVLPGERLFTTPLNQLNYMLLVWERTAYDSSDDAFIPTHSEMWAKAAFAACIISALTGCKVYVTERPYLPISDPTEVKRTVILDAPHNILRACLTRRNEISLSELPETLDILLDILSAVWQINSDYSSKDKHVAEKLEQLAVNPLAGAFFYKQYARLPDEPTPFEIYVKACEILLERKGGKMMDIAKQLADKSMGLFLPYPQYGRGKAHTYELVFREAVDAIRKVPATSLEELKSFAAGRLLKSLERRQQTRRGEGVVNPNWGNLNQLVEEFIGLLIDEVLVKRANESVAQFNRLANSFADAIYFEIDRNVQARFNEWKEKVAQRKSGKNSVA